MKYKIINICFLFLITVATGLDAKYVFMDGKLVTEESAPTMSVQEHFEAGSKAMQECDWKEAVKQFTVVAVNFPTATCAQESLYYLGISYFNVEEYDFANEAFSYYLKCRSSPQYFQEAVEYKFAIAERFTAGAKRRFFGTKQLPKWASGKSMALKIYDEVIAAVPCHDIAAQALVSKGRLLWNMKEYRDCVESFQMVIKRFPKHNLALECYVMINKVYLEQSKFEFQNPDILAFAQINLRRFQHDFPKEERLVEAENDVLSIKEIYAKGLYDTGQFYERIHKPIASVIYYQNTINQFPDTCIAELCRERLNALRSLYVSEDEENADELSVHSS